MTKKQFDKTVEELGCSEVVCNIIDQLDGTSYNECKVILDLVAFVIKEHAFVDARIAKETVEG